MSDDRFDTPQEIPPAPPAPAAVATPAMVRYLDQTRPWVLFLSILTFLSTALMAVLSAASCVVAGVNAASGGGDLKAQSIAVGGVVGFLYLVMAVANVPPGLYLYRYAGAIARLKTSRSAADLEEVLKQQRSFWRFVGILTIAAVLLSLIVMALAVVFGVAAGVMAGRS